MKTIDNKFEVGEECYTYYREKITVDCPICKGTKKIMYNGYEIPCKQCDSNGKIATNQTCVKSCKVKVKRIIANIWDEITTIKYKVDSVECYVNVKNRAENSLFKTLEECEQKCIEINQGVSVGQF